MKITAYTPMGVYVSEDEPVQPLDRAKIRAALHIRLDGTHQVVMPRADGSEVVLPAALVAQSAFLIEGVNPVPEKKEA